MDKWTPEEMLRADRPARGDDLAHGADAVAPPAGAARGGAGALRLLVDAVHGARRRAVPARGEAADDRVVGRRGHGVLRRHRGRRHDRHRQGVARAPARSARRGPAPRSASSTTTATRSRPARSAPSTWRSPRPTSSTRATRRRRRPNRIHTDDGGGFFTVGDVGELDEDGYLFLRDRKIDMIISGGVNIYPAEIEGEFLTHPKVGDVAVFGIPHADWGEEVKAVVEPAAGRRGRRRALGDELLAFASERLASLQAAEDLSTSSPRCPATRAASSTSASSATPTGKASSARSDRARRHSYWSRSRWAATRARRRPG